MEKPLKVFWNGKLLREIYPHATAFQVFKFRLKRFIRKCIIVSFSIAIIWVACIIYSNLNPAIIYTKAEVIKEVEAKSPIMQRIAGCESQGNAKLSGTQFDKNGQVLMRSNTNKSVDVGKYQINSIWFAKATELGLDVTIEADNEAMAMWIYKNRGTGDWYSSRNCWQ